MVDEVYRCTYNGKDYRAKIYYSSVTNYYNLQVRVLKDDRWLLDDAKSFKKASTAYAAMENWFQEKVEWIRADGQV